jgi:nucleotide-binding universal stress UspA family protein
MYQHILAPIDGSTTSALGLNEAIKLAKEHTALLRLLYVVDQSVIAMDPGGFGVWESVMKIQRESGERILREAKARAAEQSVEVQTKMVESLQPAVYRLILDEASSWPADLIVMGTHGRRGISRLILGSDAQGVLHGANVPVLLIRGSAER